MRALREKMMGDKTKGKNRKPSAAMPA